MASIPNAMQQVDNQGKLTLKTNYPYLENQTDAFINFVQRRIQDNKVIPVIDKKIMKTRHHEHDIRSDRQSGDKFFRWAVFVCLVDFFPTTPSEKCRRLTFTNAKTQYTIEFLILVGYNKNVIITTLQ